MMLKKKKAVIKAVPAHLAADKYEALTTADGTFQTILPHLFKERKGWTRPDPRQMFSFIPGTITELCVKEGDQVKIGDKLLMFKAMKMSNTLISAQDGTIGSIKVAVDEVVPKGVLLLEFQ